MSLVDELAGLIDEHDKEPENELPRINGVVVGRVLNLFDPLFLGRIQVRVPSIDGLDLSPWARMISPAASLFSGFYWLPGIEDEVLLIFENGDPNAPYILGAVWNAVMMPPLPSPVPQIRALRTPLGNQIVFTEVPPTVTIQSGPTAPVVMPSPPSPVGPFQTIALTPAGINIFGGPQITITSGVNVVSITPDGVKVVTPTVNMLAGSNVVSLTPAGINMISATSINLMCGPSILSLTPAGIVAIAPQSTTLTATATNLLTAGSATVVGAATVMVASAGAVLVTSAIPGTTLVGAPPKPA